MSNPVKQAARQGRNSTPVHFLVRLGYAVNGLLHALIGVIAIGVAVGGSHREADQSGALATLASSPGGVFLLWTVFVGLTALGLWLIVSAFLTGPADRKKRAGHIVSELGKGVVYLAVAATTFTYARGGSSNSARGSRKLSASLLAAPGGVLIVVLIGAVIFGIGVYFIVKGISKRFTRDLSLPAGSAGTATVVVGVVGYVAKGVVLCTVGVLFVIAAVTVDPHKSSGLDGGLKALAALPYGTVILVSVGIGLIAYALYSFVRARFAHLG
ncbi:MAG: rane protein [Glaciihabitans sp.]|nr:rane protein [Glaciihabitans sp.]